MKRKQGISLIVLVITIIVMIILAASVVLTLSNSGIINKANEAVEKTNIKEVEQLASLAWAEEFMAGKRGETLKTAVLEKLKDYTDKYTITVTDTGVTVTAGNAKSLNEYGFYYDIPYELSVEGTVSTCLVFTADKIVEGYVKRAETDPVHISIGNEEAEYAKGKITMSSEEFIVSDDGKTLVSSYEPEAIFKLSDLEYSDLCYNEKYISTNGNSYLIITEDNTITLNYKGAIKYRLPGSEIIKKGHILLPKAEESALNLNGDSVSTFAYAPPEIHYISMDGKVIKDDRDHFYFLVKENEILISGDCIGIHTCKVDEGMTWEQWVNSSYNTLGIIIDDQGYVVPTCCSEHQTRGALMTYGIDGYEYFISTSDDLIT